MQVFAGAEERSGESKKCQRGRFHSHIVVDLLRSCLCPAALPRSRGQRCLRKNDTRLSETSAQQSRSHSLDEMTIFLDSMKVSSRRKTLRDPPLGINEYIITTVNVHAMRPVRLPLYVLVLTRRMEDGWYA